MTDQLFAKHRNETMSIRLKCYNEVHQHFIFTEYGHLICHTIKTLSKRNKTCSLHKTHIKLYNTVNPINATTTQKPDKQTN